MQNNILLKNSLGEMSLDFYCDMQYKKIVKLMALIETTLNIDMNDYPDIRKEFLDISNYIKRMPKTIIEVIK